MAWGVAVAVAGVGAACEATSGDDASAAMRMSAAEAEPTATVQSSEGARTDGASASDSPSPTDPRINATKSEGLSGPPTGLVPPALGQEQLVGVVAQHLPAGGYTYLEITPEHGEPRWVVTMRRGIESGDRVRVDNLGSRHDFYSRRLDRRFAELVFGVVEVLG